MGWEERRRRWFWQNRAETTHNEVPWCQKIRDSDGQSRREGHLSVLSSIWEPLIASKVKTSLKSTKWNYRVQTGASRVHQSRDDDVCDCVWSLHHFSSCLILRRLLVSPPVINTHTHTLIIKDTAWLSFYWLLICQLIEIKAMTRCQCHGGRPAWETPQK